MRTAGDISAWSARDEDSRALRVSGRSRNGSAGAGARGVHTGRRSCDQKDRDEANVSGTTQNQQLVLDEHGFGDHRTRATRPDESGNCRQQMQNKDGQIAHGAILARSRNPGNARDLAIRHGQASIVVGKLESPPTQLAPKDAIFFHEIRDRFTFLAIHPAS